MSQGTNQQEAVQGEISVERLDLLFTQLSSTPIGPSAPAGRESHRGHGWKWFGRCWLILGLTVSVALLVWPRAEPVGKASLLRPISVVQPRAARFPDVASTAGPAQESAFSQSTLAISTSTAPSVARSKTVRLRTRSIETIAVGERVLGRNPEGIAEDELSEPDPATWRKVVLRTRKANGKRLEAVLLRPLALLEFQKVRAGGVMELNLPELGAVGKAQVVSVDSCPPIKSGSGNVVIGTFKHEPDDNLVDVRLEGLQKAIGCTDSHRFWSENKQGFIAAGDLRAGERVWSQGAGVVRVASVRPRPREAWVYNLEVQGEHVYEVAGIGVLVHNSCPIVLGETMARRVLPVAKAIGAATFNPRSTNPARWMINQVRWINTQIKSGRIIYDIGKDGLRPDRSSYYAAEVAALIKAGYTRVFQRWVTTADGRSFRLYQWIPPLP